MHRIWGHAKIPPCRVSQHALLEQMENTLKFFFTIKMQRKQKEGTVSNEWDLKHQLTAVMNPFWCWFS